MMISTTLANGLKIISHQRSSPTIGFGVFTRTGSAMDPSGLSGLAHLTEHLVFKGSKKLPQGQLELACERLGIKMDAFTSRQFSGFISHSPLETSKQSFDLLTKVVSEPEFESTAIDTEKKVVLEEMKHVNKQVDEVLFDKMHELCYNKTPFANNILGTVADIKKIQQKDLKAFHTQFFAPNNVVICTSGPMSHKEFCSWIYQKRFFASAKRSPLRDIGKISPFIQRHCSYSGKLPVRVHTHKERIEYAAFGFCLPHAVSKQDSVSFALAPAVLGQLSSASSVISFGLLSELRKVGAVQAFPVIIPYKGHGLFVIRVDYKRGAGNAVQKAVREVLSKATLQKISNECAELAVAQSINLQNTAPSDLLSIAQQELILKERMTPNLIVPTTVNNVRKFFESLKRDDFAVVTMEE